MVQDVASTPVYDARLIVSCAYPEEKGSDVNVAAHLLLDVMQGSIDGGCGGVETTAIFGSRFRQRWLGSA
jgi:hypothetical protein